MGRWLAGLLVVGGVVLVGVGLFGLHALLAAPLESERQYLARTVCPAVGGLWCVIGGVYALLR